MEPASTCLEVGRVQSDGMVHGEVLSYSRVKQVRQGARIFGTYR